jgi:lipoprotein-anchoring transpeptidase ErfK/SrfK
MRRSWVLAVALGLMISACSSSSEPGSAAGDGVAPGASPAPGTTVGDGVSGGSVNVGPLLPEGVDVVAVPGERYIPMWETPGIGDAAYSLDTRNPTGQLAPMLVAAARLVTGEAWYEVYLPLRPNGTTAWVREGDVALRERDERIEVDLSERVLRHYADGELVDRFDVGVGTPQTPTGRGTFYVWVKVPYANPNHAYGIMALGLSGFSPVLSDWPGEGRMAVHGTPYEGDRGRAVSHGCVRVYNEDMESLLDVPLGTPVVISA